MKRARSSPKSSTSKYKKTKSSDKKMKTYNHNILGNRLQFNVKASAGDGRWYCSVEPTDPELKEALEIRDSGADLDAFCLQLGDGRIAFDLFEKDEYTPTLKSMVFSVLCVFGLLAFFLFILLPWAVKLWRAYNGSA